MKNNIKIQSSRIMNYIYPIIGFILFIIIWALVSCFLGNTRMPSPWLVVNRFFETAVYSPEIRFQGAGSNGFLPHVFFTMVRYIVGTMSGMVLAFISLLFVARWSTFRDMFVPIINILRAIPPLGLAPFFLLWFGTTPYAIIGIVVFYSFVMVFVPGVEAIIRIDPVQVNFAKTLGAKKTNITLEVVMPSILPALAGPVKVAFNWSWGLVIVGELLGARSGIGRILSAFVALTATDLVVVGIIWILLLAVISEKIVELIVKETLKWAVSESNEKI